MNCDGAPSFRSCRRGRRRDRASCPSVRNSGSKCLAGRTPIDQAACAILAQLLEREHVTARVLGQDSLSISGVSRLSPDGVEALCIFYLGRQSVAVQRYSVRRLRKRFPGVPIAVCLWGGVDLPPTVEAAQADATINSLREAVAWRLRRTRCGPRGSYQLELARKSTMDANFRRTSRCSASGDTRSAKKTLAHPRGKS